MRSKLHAATPTPRRQRQGKGPHRSSGQFGGGARHQGHWTARSGRSPPRLSSYAAQCRHKCETDGRGAHWQQEMRRVSLTGGGGRRTQHALVRADTRPMAVKPGAKDAPVHDSRLDEKN
jgi:hypothetical protein